MFGPDLCAERSTLFGLVAGLLELLFLVLRVNVSEKGFFLRSAQFIWMVPVSELAIFACWGGLLAVLAWWWTGRRRVGSSGVSSS